MSNEKKSTKGDWGAYSEYGYWLVSCGVNSEPFTIGWDVSEDAKANAHLISAAPDMYKALEAALKLMEDNEVESDAYWSDGKNIDEIEKAGLLPTEILQARKALAKARGEL